MGFFFFSYPEISIIGLFVFLVHILGCVFEELFLSPLILFSLWQCILHRQSVGPVEGVLGAEGFQGKKRKEEKDIEGGKYYCCQEIMGFLTPLKSLLAG